MKESQMKVQIPSGARKDALVDWMAGKDQCFAQNYKMAVRHQAPERIKVAVLEKAMVRNRSRIPAWAYVGHIPQAFACR